MPAFALQRETSNPIANARPKVLFPREAIRVI
jgi:hypothetical protein